MIKNGYVIISEHLFARFAASSPIIACDQESCRYASVLNISGNEAIHKTNMRGQQRKTHYLAISKHASSSHAIKLIPGKSKKLIRLTGYKIKLTQPIQ